MLCKVKIISKNFFRKRHYLNFKTGKFSPFRASVDDNIESVWTSCWQIQLDCFCIYMNHHGALVVLLCCLVVQRRGFQLCMDFACTIRLHIDYSSMFLSVLMSIHIVAWTLLYVRYILYVFVV